MTAERLTGWTWHYRPVAATWPADDRLTPDRAVRILWSPAALTVTDDQFERIGRVLGLTAETARPVAPAGADRDQVTDRPTVTADRLGDQASECVA